MRIRFPRWFTIDCHNYCDASCMYCVYADLAPKKEYRQGFMDFELFNRIIGEMVEHADEVEETRFGNIAEHFVRSGLQMYVASNMTHFDSETMNRLDGLGWDGRLLAHVQPKMGVDIKVQEHNLKEAQSRWGGRVRQVIIDPPRRWAEYDKTIPFRRATHCSVDRPNHTMSVNFDGRVQLCCNDVQQQVIVGNLNESSIDEVWNGEEFKRTLSVISESRMNLCNHCEWGAE